MPKVSLISCTADARELLIFTKNTRLQMSAGAMNAVHFMNEEDKAREIAAMARTIRSSWEFVDLVFLVEGTTRAIAQQMTRTRQASYAMQSLRVVDASEIAITNPFETVDINPFDDLDDNAPRRGLFGRAADRARSAYSDLIKYQSAKEDARGILPMNTQTSLVCKYNLRAFVDLVSARESLRAQGEYGDIVRQMKALTLAQWPWSEPFFVHPQAAAIELLEEVAKSLGVTTGSGPGWDIAKAIDLLRKSEG